MRNDVMVAMTADRRVGMSRISRTVRTALVAGAFTLALAPTAALAHTQTVAPPGQDAPVILNDPIARPWIQGHCKAAAPGVSGEASGGVATFSPTQALECNPAITNPGGQSTGRP